MDMNCFYFIKDHFVYILQEITRKEDRISRLEHEKLELVKQLFQAKAEFEKEKIGGAINASIFI